MTRSVRPKTMDRFAQIAAAREELKKEGLIEPGPPELPERVLLSGKSDPTAAFRLRLVIDTPARLRLELVRQRKLHAKFLRILSPRPENTRIRRPLTEFNWRLQTEADLVDFSSTLSGKGDWERVRIPHYGGPLGRAVAYYRVSFDVTGAMRASGALFVCFEGVDYKAHVFVNGTYLGSHEGMFAPFEFECTRIVREGANSLLVTVENDAIHMGNDWGSDKDKYEGDKICAAEGPGYDDPEVGWHVTPPGMGIHQEVSIEARRPVFVRDIFVRPLPDESRAEAWIELYSCHALRQDVRVQLSVYGQNFHQTVFAGRAFPSPGPLGPGVNYFRLPFEMRNARLWDTDTPWLYRTQVKVLDAEGRLLDVATRQFGMRSFHMDEEHEPKGRLFLNGCEVRLRGANLSGSIQQCVMRKDWEQLRDDILLAKIANLNFLRLIQRPVQTAAYDFCDRLGILTQTDLPLFGVLRRNQFCEAIRQAEEMERIVRSHPCNVLISYINEPFPGAMKKPHRHLLREELEGFFRAANEAVRAANPDRVIKPADGDYDPPGPGLPDNHCYCGWYNGHGVDLGKLHKGYWQKVKPGWLYACGEFGAEALDSVELMRKYCPSHWLPQAPGEEERWTPNRIPEQTQTGRLHYLWFDTQHTVRDWVRVSRAHQEWVLRLMIEAFRRDSRMNSFAIYYFIDSWPTGWMKSIMDYDRQPKPAYFACREALAPLAVNLRMDRFVFFSSEIMEFEAWVINDLHTVPEHAFLHYQMELGGKVVFARRAKALVPKCNSAFQGFLRMTAPRVEARSHLVVRLGLLDESGRVLHDAAVGIDVFPRLVGYSGRRIFVVGGEGGKAACLATELDFHPVFTGPIRPDDVILADVGPVFRRRHDEIMKAVRSGATLVLLELPEGDYEIAGDRISVLACGMGPRHFVSRATGHPLVAGFAPDDFKFWYDPGKDHPFPLLFTTFTAPGWKPILTSGNGGLTGVWQPSMAAAERRVGVGLVRVCNVRLAGLTAANPVAAIFARRLLTGTWRQVRAETAI